MNADNGICGIGTMGMQEYNTRIIRTIGDNTQTFITG
jgi:hypothetical protein